MNESSDERGARSLRARAWKDQCTMLFHEETRLDVKRERPRKDSST